MRHIVRIPTDTTHQFFKKKERKRERVKERERERERTETKKNFFRTTRQEFVFNITMIAGLKLTDQM